MNVVVLCSARGRNEGFCANILQKFMIRRDAYLAGERNLSKKKRFVRKRRGKKRDPSSELGQERQQKPGFSSAV